MPLFDFNCETHGRFELLLPAFTESAACSNCGALSPWVPSPCAMHSDPYWKGIVDKDYGPVSSRAQLRAEMKRRGHVEIHGRADREAMQKQTEKAAAAKQQRQRQKMRRWAEKAFGPSGLGLGGADGEKLIKENK